MSLQAQALACLGRREYSRAELSRKLAPHAESVEQLEQLLDWLEQGKWLSDNRFLETVVRRRSQRFGTARILQELQMHQLDADLLAQTGEQLRETEQTRAYEVWLHKFGNPPADLKEKARQIRFLQGRGFSHAAIVKVIPAIQVSAEASAMSEAEGEMPLD